MDAILYIVGDPPAKLELGIDCYIYETGSKFKGLSVIPSGLHFLYYGTGLGPRQGFFFVANAGDVIVCTWDASNEEILPSHSLSEASLNSLKRSILIGEQNFSLGPYPLHQHHLWVNLSCFVSLQTLRRAECDPGALLLPGDETDTADIKLMDTVRRRAGGSGADVRTNNGDTAVCGKEIKVFFSSAARVARFLNINAIDMMLIEAANTKGIFGDITSMMMDKSLLLERIVSKDCDKDWTLLLGELQLSFMLFMFLYSYPALQQWKLLSNTICNSEKFILRNADFTSGFMKVLFSQLKFSPDDFFQAELSQENFLRPILTALFSSLNGSTETENGDSSLREHQHRLLTFVQKKFSLFEGMSCVSTENTPNLLLAAQRRQQRQAEVDEQQEEGGDDDQPVVMSEAEFMQTMKRIGGLEDDNHEAETISIDNSNSGGKCNNVASKNVKFSSTVPEETMKPESSSVADRWATIDEALFCSTATMSIRTSNATATPLTIQLPTAHVIPFPNTAATISGSTAVKPMAKKMDVAAIEAQMFCWRYPLLFDATRWHGSCIPTTTDDTYTDARGEECCADSSCGSGCMTLPEDEETEACGVTTTERTVKSKQNKLTKQQQQLKSAGAEDMTMAAMRIIEHFDKQQHQYQLARQHQLQTETLLPPLAPSPLYAEAMRFVLEEVSVRKDMV